MKTFRNSTLSFLSLLGMALISFLATASKADAQVLVYKMEFSKSGRSINFDFYDQGFFVVDGLGGTGTFVVTYREGGRDFYLSSASSGELFFAVRPGSEKAVIRATAENGTAQSQYLLIGDLSSKISVNLRGQKVTLAVCPFLSGSALASDSEADVDFLAADGSIGLAGFANIKASLERTKTRNANKANQSVDEAVADLISSLESQGIENASVAEITEPEPDTGTDTTL